MDLNKKPYNVLGVSENASHDEIRKAYRKLALKYHPDTNQGDAESEAKFKEVSEAYSVIGDEGKRKEYHKLKKQADFMSQFNAERFNAHFNPSPQTNNNIFIKVPISLEEVFYGSVRKLTYDRQIKCRASCENAKNCMWCEGKGVNMNGLPCQNCNSSGIEYSTSCGTCKGTGNKVVRNTIDLRIHQGMLNMQTMILPSQGDVDAFGSVGNLKVEFHVKRHETYMQDRINPLNLVTTQKLSYIEVILGSEIEIPYFDKKLKIKIPPFTDMAEPLRLKGKGIYSKISGEQGDLFLYLSMKKEKITEEEIELLEQIKKLRENGRD